MKIKKNASAPLEPGTDANVTISNKIIGEDGQKVNAKRKTAGQKRLADRKRVFATVVYPESAPEDWKERLNQVHVAALVSPLHDKDVNPDGEFKKAHYHVMLIFESPKDFESQVKPIFDSIGGVGRETVNSMRGYARYLCHLDNPEKFQYNTADVLQLSGADYAEIIRLPTDDSKMLIELFGYIRTNQIYSLAELIDLCAVNNRDWFNMITMSRAYIVDKYIKSLMWEQDAMYVRRDDRQVKVDPETGEVVLKDTEDKNSD